ncbi:TIGR03086 family protein [Nocardia panacis]|uniref:TIGR03086 family protein n=2 Tax=Nocardia panacis TaxID=2340916 RepID=A0A3A4K1Y4_9NOCA|nr:TIGR03086 family protein [Nocardia panacis]
MKECAAEAARVARGVGADQLSMPTPCTEFDLRALVNHWVLHSSYGLECRALRRSIPEELRDRDFTTDPEWAEAYAAQLDRAVHAWTDPGVWEGEIDLSGTSTPAPVVATMLLPELALHGWDVAVATGQKFRMSAASAATLQQIIDSGAQRYRAYDMFAQAVAWTDGTDPFLRVVAASGRNPHWASSIRT